MIKKFFKFLIILFLVFISVFSIKSLSFSDNFLENYDEKENAQKLESDLNFLKNDDISKKDKIARLKKIISIIQKKIEKIILQKKMEENILKNNAFDFYSKNINLEKKVQEEFSKLSEEEKAGMVLMPAFDKNSTFTEIKKYIQEYKIGGILTLSKNPDKKLLQKLENYNLQKLPLLFSADAESSLLKYRFSNFEKKNKDIGNTSDIKSEKKSREIAQRISKMLFNEGYEINFAPVYDISKNKEIIADRAFSSENAVVQKLANSFMIETQKDKIFATAKHFPGHGNVVGDSHKMLPEIKGKLLELENFKSAIEKKVVFIMVGHLAIKNNKKWNTEIENNLALPATLSKKIITDLLKKELNFKGIVITDAMNMKGVSQIKNAEIKSLKAGADIILMPENIEKVYKDILFKIKNDKEFSKIIDEKVKKIVRIKIISIWNRGEF